MVNGRLSDRAKSTEWMEIYAATAWPAWKQRRTSCQPRAASFDRDLRGKPRAYADLRVFKRIGANLRQPVASIGTCTRRYGTYSKCKPVRPVTRRVKLCLTSLLPPAFGRTCCRCSKPPPT